MFEHLPFVLTSSRRAAAFAISAIAVVALVARGPRSEASAAQGTFCSLPTGGHVLLESDAVDPQVFLWDSRVRLIDYAAGEWKTTRSVLTHTVLAEPGTQAMIVACIPAAAHPKFSSADEDAIGVKVMSGPYRGRYGWVLSSDIHAARPTGQSATAGVPHN